MNLLFILLQNPLQERPSRPLTTLADSRLFYVELPGKCFLGSIGMGQGKCDDLGRYGTPAIHKIQGQGENEIPGLVEFRITGGDAQI